MFRGLSDRDATFGAAETGSRNVTFIRFWSKTAQVGDCLEWTGSRLKGRGYGLFHFEGKTQRAHRVAWFLTHGEWPSANVLHTCDNPACVLPLHLFDGDQRDNVLDMYAKGRESGAPRWQAAKTHCSHGHEFSDDNVWIDSTGARRCRTCRREAHRRWREAKSA